MLITLLTDFGTSDYFVGAMKGRILSADRSITIVDLTHEVPPHDIEAAAFLLHSCYRDFPAGTVHLIVVDPGVGSSRLPIAVEAVEQLFVAPDNGVLSFILAESPGARVRQIEARDGGTQISSTFHGRDIFAPAAAELACGRAFDSIGPVVNRPVRLPLISSVKEPDGSLYGRVLHVDHFGNCVTSFRSGELDSATAFVLESGDQAISELRPFYESSEDAGPFLIAGSAGFLELSMLRGSAAERLGLTPGAPLLLRLLP